MTTQTQTLSFEEQIIRLESEIAAQQSDIRNLQEALATIEAGKPRPVNPAADNAFELLKQLVGSVPDNLEQEQQYLAKLAEAQRALELAIAAIEQKQQRIDALRQERRGQQQQEAFEQLRSRAAKYNNLIDAAMTELEQMRSLSQVAGSGGRFEIVADLNETPYCAISQSLVRVRRRFDVLRG